MLVQDFISDAMTIPHQHFGDGYVVQKEQATCALHEHSFAIYHYGRFVIRLHDWPAVSAFYERTKKN